MKIIKNICWTTAYYLWEFKIKNQKSKMEIQTRIKQEKDMNERIAWGRDVEEIKKEIDRKKCIGT